MLSLYKKDDYKMKKVFTLILLCLPFLAFSQRIAVLEFKPGVGVSISDVDGLSSIFTTYFAPEGYTLVERSQIDRVIDEQQFQRSSLSERQMVRIGEILNLSKIVVGNINVIMGEYNVDVRVINIESGTIAATEGSSFSSGSYRERMKNLAQNLAKKISITTIATSQDRGGGAPAVGRGAAEEKEEAAAALQRERQRIIDLFDMVYVEGGTFTMGATSEQGSDVKDNEKPAHSVTLSSYYIGKYEVTQKQWVEIMGSNPSLFKGDNLPVENVSWYDVQEFLRRLNAKTGKRYRLPTEAEWEYAARGGNRSWGYKYSGSNDIGTVAWYDVNSTHPVGSKSPNELGIYDMTGNVWEWCSDWADSYSSTAQTNPQGPATGTFRVLRGGSWYNFARFCRVSYRASDLSPDYRRNHCGFRLVLSL